MRAVGALRRLQVGPAVAVAALGLCPATSDAVTLAKRDGISVTAERPGGRIAIVGGAREALVEATGSEDRATGRLGFLAGGTWHRAVSVEDLRRGDAAGELQLATSDPAGRGLALSVRIQRSGIVELDGRVTRGPVDDVTAIGMGFESRGGERYLGFGERSNAVDQSGRTVENYVSEGPFQDNEYAIVDLTIPDWGLRRSVDATYFPMPWLVSTRGYGMLADNPQSSRFRLGSEAAGEWSIEVDAPTLELRFFPGPEPADVVRRLTAEIGRQPEPAEPWVLGPWFQTGHQNEEPDELAYVEILRGADAPVSAVETHMRYMPCGSDQGREEAERARTRAFHEAGLAALSYSREAICASYGSAFGSGLSSGAFIRRADGSPYLYESFVGGGVQPVGQIDFTNPAGEALYASVVDRMVANGYDGWMEDYGEYTPPDAVAADGTRGIALHNLYPLQYHEGAHRYRQARRPSPVSFIRSGWTGVHPNAEIVWGGDPTTGFGFDGLESSLTQALTMGLSGISLWASDIGGFFTLSDQRLTPELLARWIEFGAVSGVMRTKAEGVGAAKSDRPQIWEQPTLPIWRRYAKLRTQLYPYLVAADRRYRRTGMPIMRHLALAFPDDRRARASDDSFMFGSDLLAAPVVADGAREREVYLPEGRWIDLWRSVRYRERDGSLAIRRARELRGARTVSLPAPLDELPLLARAGSLIPLLPPEVDTLADYGTDGDLVGLTEREDRLELLAFPRGRSAARFGEDGRLRSRELSGAWRLSLAAERRRKLDVQASLRTLRDPFDPARILVDGEPLPRRSWSYAKKGGIVRFELDARAARVVVDG